VPSASIDLSRVRAVILDIDGTLYDSPPYVEAQTRVQVEAWARERGVPYARAVSDLEEARDAWARAHGGERTSLANALLSLGVPMERSVKWRTELLDPARWLAPDPRLARALSRASEAARICSVTNNPRSVGLKTLEALGIAGSFEFIVGLDDTMKSKPSREPFELALSRLGMPPESCLSVGDRHDVDLAVPLSMGMQGCLVSGPSDVVALLDALSDAR
jgi:FMN phosphatase YigB (HAD superfamily)